MDLLDAIAVACILCGCDRARRTAHRRLLATQRLIVRYPPEPTCNSPSPHQLLGEVARPLRV